MFSFLQYSDKRFISYVPKNLCYEKLEFQNELCVTVVNGKYSVFKIPGLWSMVCFWNLDMKSELVKETLFIISLLGFWFFPGVSDSTYNSNMIGSF